MKNIIYLSCLFLAFLSGLSAQEQRELVIGGDGSLPPYEYLDASGQPVGYNVELSTIIAEKIGAKPVFRLAKWSRVREDLETGRIHLIQGMAFSSERAKTLSFSNPHTATWRAIFVRKDSKIKSITELMSSRILVQEGDIAIDYFREQDFKGELVELPNQDNALQLVDSGIGDAALVNYMHGMYLINHLKLDNIKTIPGKILPKFYCFASKDENLIREVNNVLAELSSNGQLDSLHKKWFEQYDPELLSISKRLRMVRSVHFVFWFITAAVLLGLLYTYHRFRKKCKKQMVKLEDLLQEYDSLLLDYTIFHKGPLVAYKYKIKPFRLLYVSEGLRAWGFDPQKALAREEGFDDILHPEDRAWVDKQLELQILSRTESEKRQYRIINKSGEIRWVLDFNLILYAPDGDTIIYGYMADITTQKQLETELIEAKEKAESASVAKGQFLASMSHEIRTPLNGIMGFVQVLMQMEASPEQKEYLNIIYNSGNNLMKIVNDILDVSKIESGKMELIISEFDPVFLISDIVKSFALRREKSSIDIRMKLGEDLPRVLYGDMMRLKQILINLLQNAVKFTDSGYIEVTADIYNQTASEIRLLLSVADTGIGIDPKKQSEIFDNFSQLDNTVTRRYGGTGLGLAIVKRLVELMNGFIWVESEIGEGSHFFFIIPFQKKNEVIMPTLENRLDDIDKQDNLPPLNILLVEDELINQNATRRQLERWGLKVTVAANGAEALGHVEQEEYDCILMDVQMPVMDGVTATRKIREFEASSGRHTVIYAYTALAMSGDKERFLEAGMDDYISKPVNLVHLFSLLQKVAQAKA